MIVLLLILALLFIFGRKTFAIYLFLRNLKLLGKLSSSGKIDSNKIAIIIPVLYESREMIKACINHFSKIKNRQIKIFFVTSKKEGRGVGSSFQIIKEEIGKSNNFKLMHSNIDGNKGAQLEYVINKLNKNKTIFGIYDVDSRPDLRAVDYLSSIDHTQSAYQQYTLYDANFEKLSWLNKSGSVFQSFWSIYFESSFAFGNALDGKMRYLVGHGLFIDGETLKKNHFFTKAIAEDLMMGYNLSMNGVKTRPLPYFEHSSFAKNFIVNIKQTSRWFKGELEMLKYFPKNILLYLRFSQLMLWPLEPIVLWTTLIFSIKYHYLLVPVLAVFIVIFMQGLIASHKLRFVDKPKASPITLALGNIPWTMSSFIGPAYLIARSFTSKSIIPYKTEK